MDRRVHRWFAALAVLPVAAACATAPVAPKKPLELRYEAADYVLGAGTAAQTKGSVTAELEPPSYKPKLKTQVTCVPKQRIQIAIDKEYVVTRTPAIVPPITKQFRIAVKNGMQQALSLDGVAATLRVDRVENKVSLRVRGEGRILPGHEEQLFFDAPALVNFRDGATVVVSLFGVVTATDAAGNATARSRFDWEYKVAKATRAEQAFEEQEVVTMSSWHAGKMCQRIDEAPLFGSGGK